MKIQEAKNSILQEDCIEEMKKLPENSIDSIITDPPYGLNFMGKGWDSYTDNQAFQEWTRRWAKEALRVAKPGAMILVFGGTRTFHRIACGLEDAGWEIRDTMMWMYGSGFPKSYNIAKGIDKKLGNEREDLGESKNNRDRSKHKYNSVGNVGSNARITKGNTKWEGYGTALKPAYEPIIVAMKSVEKTFVNNALKWNVAGINIDGCRISHKENDYQVNMREDKTIQAEGKNDIYSDGVGKKSGDYFDSKGRFPTNIIMECTCDEVKEGEVKSDGGEGKAPTNYKLSKNRTGQNYFNYANSDGTETTKIHTDPNCPCYMLDEQSGISESSKGKCEAVITEENRWKDRKGIAKPGHKVVWEGKGDKGGASRFFKQVRPDRFKYTPKASKEERNLGCENMEEKDGGHYRQDEWSRKNMGNKPDAERDKVRNDHPTVKPISLLKYLCKLTKTPDGGVVLDPFIGSGTTAIACVLTGRDYIGIEKNEEYINIAKARLNYWKKPKHRREAYKKRKKRKKKHSKENKSLEEF